MYMTHKLWLINNIEFSPFQNMELEIGQNLKLKILKDKDSLWTDISAKKEISDI